MRFSILPKLSVFVLFYLIFVSALPGYVYSLLQREQPTPAARNPFFLTLAQSPLLFDRERTFFEHKMFWVRGQKAEVVIDGTRLKREIPYVQALLFLHNFYGDEPSEMKARLLQKYFCGRLVKFSSAVQPKTVEWIVGSRFRATRSIYQSVECK